MAKLYLKNRYFALSLRHNEDDNPILLAIIQPERDGEEIDIIGDCVHQRLKDTGFDNQLYNNTLIVDYCTMTGLYADGTIQQVEPEYMFTVINRHVDPPIYTHSTTEDDETSIYKYDDMNVKSETVEQKVVQSMDNSYDFYVMGVHKNDPYDSQPLCELKCLLEKEPDIINDNIHNILKNKGHSLGGEYHLVIINKRTGIGVSDNGYVEHYNVDDVYSTFQYNKPPGGFYEYVIDAIPPKNNSPKFLYEIDGIVVTEDEYNQRVRITPVKEMTLEEIEKELGYKIILKK